MDQVEIFLLDEKAKRRKLEASTPQAVQKAEVGPSYDLILFEWSKQRLVELQSELHNVVL
jgi:hypothetical protein